MTAPPETLVFPHFDAAFEQFVALFSDTSRVDTTMAGDTYLVSLVYVDGDADDEDADEEVLMSARIARRFPQEDMRPHFVAAACEMRRRLEALDDDYAGACLGISLECVDATLGSVN